MFIWWIKDTFQNVCHFFLNYLILQRLGNEMVSCLSYHHWNLLITLFIDFCLSAVCFGRNKTYETSEIWLGKRSLSFAFCLKNISQNVSSHYLNGNKNAPQFMLSIFASENQWSRWFLATADFHTQLLVCSTFQVELVSISVYVCFATLPLYHAAYWQKLVQ